MNRTPSSSDKSQTYNSPPLSERMSLPFDIYHLPSVLFRKDQTSLSVYLEPTYFRRYDNASAAMESIIPSTAQSLTNLRVLQGYEGTQDQDEALTFNPYDASVLDSLGGNAIISDGMTPHLRPSSVADKTELLNCYSTDLFRTQRNHYRTQVQRENHILAERQRREEMNDKFALLRSMIPRLTKKDKASIVGDTINYITELEKKVRYLQACRITKDKSSVFKQRGKKLDAKQSEQRVITVQENVCQEIARVEDSAIIKSRQQQNEIKEVAQVEVQNLGHKAVIKILSERRRGIVLRLHIALDECKVDVLQSNVTTIGDRMIHFITVELIPGVSAATQELISALQLASSSGI